MQNLFLQFFTPKSLRFTEFSMKKGKNSIFLIFAHKVVYLKNKFLNNLFHRNFIRKSFFLLSLVSTSENYKISLSENSLYWEFSAEYFGRLHQWEFLLWREKFEEILDFSHILKYFRKSNTNYFHLNIP